VILDVLLQDYPNPDEASLKGIWVGKNKQQEKRKEIAEIKRRALKTFSERFVSLPALAYYARYEYARALRAVQEEEASGVLVELYCSTLKQGLLPPITGDFEQLVAAADGDDLEELTLRVKEIARLLVRQERRQHLFALAWQRTRNGNPLLAEELFSIALSGRLAGEEQRATILAAVDYLWKTNQYARAVALLQPLLEEPQAARDSGLWRLAAAAGDNPEVCWTAARVLLAVGEQETAWDYLTTPLVGQEGTALPHLAVQLEHEGYLTLAARAYGLATEAEPGNAALFWDRINVLNALGRSAEADALLRRLAEEEWDRRFQAIQQEAREQLRK
jgi:hypothetical protein